MTDIDMSINGDDYWNSHDLREIHSVGSYSTEAIEEGAIYCRLEYRSKQNVLSSSNGEYEKPNDVQDCSLGKFIICPRSASIKDFILKCFAWLKAPPEDAVKAKGYLHFHSWVRPVPLHYVTNDLNRTPISRIMDMHNRITFLLVVEIDPQTIPTVESIVHFLHQCSSSGSSNQLISSLKSMNFPLPESSIKTLLSNSHMKGNTMSTIGRSTVNLFQRRLYLQWIKELTTQITEAAAVSLNGILSLPNCTTTSTNKSSHSNNSNSNYNKTFMDSFTKSQFGLNSTLPLLSNIQQYIRTNHDVASSSSRNEQKDILSSLTRWKMFGGTNNFGKDDNHSSLLQMDGLGEIAKFVSDRLRDISQTLPNSCSSSSLLNSNSTGIVNNSSGTSFHLSDSHSSRPFPLPSMDTTDPLRHGHSSTIHRNPAPSTNNTELSSSSFKSTKGIHSSRISLDRLKPRVRRRTSFDPSTEIPFLMQRYLENSHPDRETIQLYVDTLNRSPYRLNNRKLDLQNVICWFKNHRACAKKKYGRSIFSKSKENSNSVHTEEEPSANDVEDDESNGSCDMQDGEEEEIIEEEYSYSRLNPSRIHNCKLEVTSEMPYIYPNSDVVVYPPSKRLKPDPILFDIFTNRQDAPLPNPSEDLGNQNENWDSHSIDVNIDENPVTLCGEKDCTENLERSKSENQSATYVKKEAIIDQDGCSRSTKESIRDGTSLSSSQSQTHSVHESDDIPILESSSLPLQEVADEPSPNDDVDEPHVDYEQPSSPGGSHLLHKNSFFKARRSRCFIDPVSEIARLETWFITCQHPTQEEMERICTELNAGPYRINQAKLEVKNIQLWFKNRRAKHRKTFTGSDRSIKSTAPTLHSSNINMKLQGGILGRKHVNGSSESSSHIISHALPSSGNPQVIFPHSSADASGESSLHEDETEATHNVTNPPERNTETAARWSTTSFPSSSYTT